MCVVAELRFVIRLQDEAYYFLQQFVGPGGQAKRAQVFAVFLGDVDPSHWRPAIPFAAQGGDHGIDFRQGHAIDGVGRRAWSQSTIICIDVGVGTHIQGTVVELAVDIFQR
jgi:hypothetical protein